MRKKVNKEENEDQVMSEMKELYQNKLNEKEALKNLLFAIARQNDHQVPAGRVKDPEQQ